jgi:hypothetical protein
LYEALRSTRQHASIPGDLTYVEQAHVFVTYVAVTNDRSVFIGSIHDRR